MGHMLELSWEHIDDQERYAVYDMDFHLAIAKGSQNSIIHRSVEMLKALYTVWLRNFVRVHGNEKSNDFHTRVFEAIKKRDAETARRHMMDHLMDVLHKVQLDATKRPGASARETSDSVQEENR